MGLNGRPAVRGLRIGYDMEVFGIDKEKWDVINGLANWLVAIGTISAVVVSLQLARASSAIKARLSAKARIMLLGDGTEGQSIIQFEVINTGSRSFEVVSIGWKYGKGKSSRYFFQLFDMSASSRMPIRLQESERGNWHFQIDLGDGWYQRMSREFSSEWSRELRSFRAFASLSTGEEIECSPDESITEKLRNELSIKST